VRRSFDKETGATSVVVVIFSPYRRKGDALGIRGFAGIRSGGLLWSCCKNEFKELRNSRTCARVMMKGGSKRKQNRGCN